MPTWVFKSHYSTYTSHSSAHEDTETGIVRETHTRYRDHAPVGKPKVCYWHPSEPKGITHKSFEECLAAIQK